MNKDVRALKDALENLNTRKSTSRRVLKRNFVENFLLGKTPFKLAFFRSNRYFVNFLSSIFYSYLSVIMLLYVIRI